MEVKIQLTLMYQNYAEGTQTGPSETTNTYVVCRGVIFSAQHVVQD